MAHLYRFGLFELNTASRELLKQGRRVRLQEQPRRVLEMLLESPGSLVTRSELRQRLWPSDIHVDFELGLTGAMKRLRLALGDSADNPRFIETVPKSGYRFIAPVHTIEISVEQGAEPSTAPRPATSTGAAAVAPARIPARRLSYRAGTLTSLGIAIVALIAAYLLRPQTPLPHVNRIVKLSDSGRAWRLESLLTDGARLYYSALSTNGKFGLRQILLNGNEETPVAGMPPDSLVRALSSDHTMFAAISLTDVQEARPSPIWVLPVIGGPARRLGSVLSDDFAWSPDGNALAFARDNHVWLGDASGEHARLLADVPGHVYLPRWSPDGRRLRFGVEMNDGQLRIWEVAADGSHPHEVKFGLPRDSSESFGEWTADGKYFVFCVTREGVSNLWAVADAHDWLHSAKSEAVQLTTGPLNYYRPLPSLDGSRVFALGTQFTGELVRYDIKRKEFVPFLGGRSADHVQFSPDGRWVAYVAYPEDTLWRSRSDGSEAVQLTFPPLRVTLPRWSPDSKRIAFSGGRLGELPRVFTISVEGGNADAIPYEPQVQADASWSPDGALFYGKHPGEDPQAAVYRLDLSTGKAEKIAGSEGFAGPLLSPDGKLLLGYSPAGPGRSLLSVFDLQTHSRRSLSARNAIYPAWSRDSQWIYFNTLMSPEPALYRVRISDDREEKVADVPFHATGIYGSWSGLAPDGSLLLLRDKSQTDVYALSLQK